MAFCAKCGAQIEDGAKFCPACGASVGENGQGAQQQQQQTQGGFADKVKNINNTADTTSEYDANDIQNNKAMAVLSYFGLLALIPFFCCKQSKYAQFHAKQGMTLLIVDVCYSIVSFLLNLIKVTRVSTTTYYGIAIPYEYQVTPWFISVILWILGLGILALVIIGIINAAQGKAKELPLIGKIKIFK